jgi:hypothetical protein
MPSSTKERDPDWDSYPSELKRVIDTIKNYGSDSLDEMQRMLVVQIFRVAAMTTEPRVVHIRNKIQEAHLEYCFKLPTLRRK